MKKFLVIYNTPVEAQVQMSNATPEEKMEGMKPWLAWNERVGGDMVDFGAPTAGAQVLKGQNNWKASPSETSGYSIVQAESLEALKSHFQDHPHTSWSNETSIEIHECMAM